MKGIRVLVADSQRLVSDALRLALQDFTDLDVLDETPTVGADAVAAIVRLEPNVALLDYWLSGMEGPAATQAILREVPDCKVLLLSWFHGSEQIEKALDAGAIGFVPKSVVVSDLADAIRRAHAGEPPLLVEGEHVLVATVKESGESPNDLWRRLLALTAREIEVLEVLSYGRPIGESARTLGITPGTLRNHIHKILKKTNTSSLVEALSLARRAGIIRT